MAIYLIKGINKSGEKIELTEEAADQNALAEGLSKNGTTIISIKEKKDSLKLEFADSFLKRLSRVKIDDLVMFSIQLSNMLGAGIALPAALSTLVEQTENKKLKEALIDIAEKIKQGAAFSDSLAMHKDIFSTVFINMIAAGEASGNLEEILSRLATFVEHEAELKQKISGAMLYPMILLVAGIGVISYVVTAVLPPFVKIFIDSGVPLPAPTKVLYGLNLFIRAYWIFIMAALGITWTALIRYGKTEAGKMAIDLAKLRVPLWGNLLRKVTIARLCRTLSTMLSSGVPMLQAIEIAEKTIDVSPVALAVRNASSAVGKGETISKAFKKSGHFPPMVIQMIAIGEETGTLETMLNKIADFYDLAAEYAIKKLTTMLEPIFLVVIGGMVGFIFASILLPIFNMIQVIKH